ncbi:zinc-ribbon domain-containing protein [Haloplanus litoreus]|uniref:Zinc-ribbon domain-containing protein n=1 Tax=Haloplanus litoreus TaxID=767515 RepID=A0ABD5ZWM9_9EURY
MVVAQTLSVVLYGAAVAGDHPDIDAPENLSNFSGFLRIGAIILLLVGLATAVGNLSSSAFAATGFAFVVVVLLGLYDYTIIAKKKRKAAKDTVAKAGKEYLETKKEVEKGPDQVTNVQGDVVDRKHQQTHVDRSTTSVDTIDQSTTHVDRSKTVKDQRTQVEDSVVNRSDITAAAEGRSGDATGANPGDQHPGTGAQPRGGAQPHTERSPQGGHSPPDAQQSPGTRASGGGSHSVDQHAPEGRRRQSGHPGNGSESPDQSEGGTRYCTSCGEEVEADWNTCISCGADL